MGILSGKVAEIGTLKRKFSELKLETIQNIHPPSETLHLSNIPQDVTEHELREKFEDIGTTVEDFRFFQ